MILKDLIKYLTPSKQIKDYDVENMKVKIFDRNKEIIGDPTSITIERHDNKLLVIINTKLEDLK